MFTVANFTLYITIGVIIYGWHIVYLNVMYSIAKKAENSSETLKELKDTFDRIAKNINIYEDHLKTFLSIVLWQIAEV